MIAPSGERKLTTILAADSVAYSRHMGRDEAATLATLKTYRTAMIAQLTDHGGRVFNMAGDSLLAEFPSIVKAVESAIRIQRDLAKRNAAVPEERPLRQTQSPAARGCAAKQRGALARHRQPPRPVHTREENHEEECPDDGAGIGRRHDPVHAGAY